jgi:hypothetical protein
MVTLIKSKQAMVGVNFEKPSDIFAKISDYACCNT